MKEVNVMKVVFDARIESHEIPAFRGAVIKKAGLENDLYHNHNNQLEATSKYHYRYPLIQYRQEQERPALVFVDQGIPEAQHFLSQPDWDIQLSGRTESLSIRNMQARKAHFGVTDSYRYYNLYRWQALNEENMRAFMASEDLGHRIDILRKVLNGNILAFANGIEYHIPDRFEVQITHLFKRRTEPYEGIKAQVFDVRIKTNLLFPPYIALGKGVSLGFGTLRLWRDKSTTEEYKHDKNG